MPRLFLSCGLALGVVTVDDRISARSAVDDVARTAKTRSHCASACWAGTNARPVLRLAAEKAGWGRRLPRGHGMGIALSAGFDSFCAQVIEVAISGRQLHIERIVCAFDCGQIVDPHNVARRCRAVPSGETERCARRLDLGLSAAGAARESNFHDAPIPASIGRRRSRCTWRAAPPAPGGAGEASVPPVAPALASAIHAATGRRPRRLPLIEAGFR
ncbi:MAG: hypothetical protein U1F11_12015 [Steroidobacteraceae bacterium]